MFVGKLFMVTSSTPESASLRRLAPRLETTIPSLAAEGTRAVNEFIARIESWGVSHDEALALRHGLHEAVMNAIRHGNAGCPERSVRISAGVDRCEVWLEVEDEGEGFNCESIADPTLPGNLERPGGRGLLMMRHFLTSVEFNERGNRVHLRLLCQELLARIVPETVA